MPEIAEDPRSGASEGPGRARAQFAAERDSMSRNSIPRLIELLESADLRTRFLAEMCLRDATNT